jgi:hypothetical protein
MDENPTDPDPGPGTQRPDHTTSTGGAAGTPDERIGQQDPASDGEDPSPS